MEYAQPVHMCFVDLEKAYDHVPSVLWGIFWESGIDGLSWSFNLCIVGANAWFTWESLPQVGEFKYLRVDQE